MDAEFISKFLPLQEGKSKFSDLYTKWWEDSEIESCWKDRDQLREIYDYNLQGETSIPKLWVSTALLLYDAFRKLLSNYTIFQGTQEQERDLKKKGFVYAPLWVDWRGYPLPLNFCINDIEKHFRPMAKKDIGILLNNNERLIEKPFKGVFEYRSMAESKGNLLLVCDGEMSFRILELFFAARKRSKDYKWERLLRDIGITHPQKSGRTNVIPTARAVRLAIWLYLVLTSNDEDSSLEWYRFERQPLLFNALKEQVFINDIETFIKDSKECLVIANCIEDCEKCLTKRACGPSFIRILNTLKTELENHYINNRNEFSHISFNILGHFGLRRCWPTDGILKELYPGNNDATYEDLFEKYNRVPIHPDYCDPPCLERGLVGFRLFVTESKIEHQKYDAYSYWSVTDISDRYLLSENNKQFKHFNDSITQLIALENAARDVGESFLLSYAINNIESNGDAIVCKLSWADWRKLHPNWKGRHWAFAWHHIDGSKPNAISLYQKRYLPVFYNSIPKDMKDILNMIGRTEDSAYFEQLKIPVAEREPWIKWDDPPLYVILSPEPRNNHYIEKAIELWRNDLQRKINCHVNIKQHHWWFNVAALLKSLELLINSDEGSKYYDIKILLFDYEIAKIKGLIVKVLYILKKNIKKLHDNLCHNQYWPYSKESREEEDGGKLFGSTMPEVIDFMRIAGAAWIIRIGHEIMAGADAEHKKEVTGKRKYNVVTFNEDEYPVLFNDYDELSKVIKLEADLDLSESFCDYPDEHIFIIPKPHTVFITFIPGEISKPFFRSDNSLRIGEPIVASGTWKTFMQGEPTIS